MREWNRAVSVVLMAAYLLAGCTKTVSVPPAQVNRGAGERVVGVVLIDGTRIDFPALDGRVGRDTVYRSGGAPIPLDSVNHLLVRRDDPLMTFVAVLGGAAGALGVGIVIALATKESCPFVYSWDGNRWVFDAEPYGGAITRGLERDDYGLLEHLRPVDGEYRLLVTNEVNESQMTDQLQLLVVDHAAGFRPVADEFGRFHTVAEPRPPIMASDQTGTDLTNWLARPDDLVWERRPAAEPGQTRDTITLTFAKPPDATTMKLVTRVATGAWGSHQIRTLLGLFGGSVDQWYRGIDANPLAADSVRKWGIREGLYGLSIEVREPDGWHARGLLAGGGPFLAEDRVITLDVSRVSGPRVVRREHELARQLGGVLGLGSNPDQVPEERGQRRVPEWMAAGVEPTNQRAVKELARLDR